MRKFYTNEQGEITRQEHHDSTVQYTQNRENHDGVSFICRTKDDNGQWADRGAYEVPIFGQNITDKDVVIAYHDAMTPLVIDGYPVQRPVYQKGAGLLEDTAPLDYEDIAHAVAELTSDGPSVVAPALEEFSKSNYNKFAIVEAARSGDLTTIEKFASFDLFESPEEEERYQDTLQHSLVYASMAGNQAIVQTITSRLDKSQDTQDALDYAMERSILTGQNSVVEFLSNHVDLRQDDSQFLRLAAQSGQTVMVDKMAPRCDAHSALKRMESDNQEMLKVLDGHESGYERGINLLMQHLEKLDGLRTDVGQRGRYADSIRDAAENGDDDAVRKFLSKGAHPDDAIESAAWYGHREVVKTLVDRGGDAEVGLVAAAGGGHDKIVKDLVERGQQSKDLALVNAAENGHLKVCNRLLYSGANADAHDHDALKRAMRNDHSDVVDTLIHHSKQLDSFRRRLISAGDDATVKDLDSAQQRVNRKDALHDIYGSEVEYASKKSNTNKQSI